LPPERFAKGEHGLRPFWRPLRVAEAAPILSEKLEDCAVEENMAEDRLESVHEAGAILRGEREAARRTRTPSRPE